VDHIEGLSPAIAIEQKATRSANSAMSAARRGVRRRVRANVMNGSFKRGVRLCRRRALL
jgi:hypothetical protein